MIVYQHIRLDTNEVFYIGIGNSTNRAYYKHGRNNLWNKVVSKTDYKVEIVCICNDWNEACDIERYLISYYGRKDLNKGTLVNLTDGGEGLLGHIHSEESLLKISESKKGCTSPNKGKVMTEEQKLKISISKKTTKCTYNKVILDTLTGVFYETVTQASFYYNINRTTLNAMLKGQNPNKTNLKYV